MKKILIIEDNDDVRETTADILELANYDVITAQNGKVGVEKVQKQKPDLIICDIMMPELDGYDVLQTLSKEASTRSIPFIFLTAKTEKVDMRKGMNLGADDYLTKPFEEHELLEAIESRLKKNAFLKKEFSKDIKGLNAFIEEASDYIDLENLSRDFSVQEFKKRDDIFNEGNAANKLYFIESGIVKTYRITEFGKEFVTGLYKAGDFLGQLSLLSNQGRYSDTATVLEEAKVYGIPKVDFMKLIQGNQVVSNKFISMISNNLIDMQEQLVNMAFATVRQKLAITLLDLYNRQILTDKEDASISIPREDLAGIIGTATETAIRMLTKFKEEGLVTIGRNSNIFIQDKKAIERITHFD
ncbi:MAG: response regulator [Mesonia hippocampi]|uniref:response regulator n=1 Tax=Mesonia hippocampi TaxID=1628250 RepID=UPI003F9E6B4C